MVDRALTVLLPPSEGKAPGGHLPGGAGSFDALLGPARATVLDHLATELERSDLHRLSALLSVRGELLERALEAVTALVNGTAPVVPAWQRYTGVVWAGLDAGSLEPSARRRVLVPSGLYGVTTALDPVADYRLKMSVVLGGLGRLSAFWRPQVTAALRQRCRGRTVVDLLPAEHAVAVDVGGLSRSTVVIPSRFISSKGDRAVGHEAKAAKGHLARLLLSEGLAAAQGFRWEGWKGTVDDSGITVTAP